MVNIVIPKAESSPTVRHTKMAERKRMKNANRENWAFKSISQRRSFARHYITKTKIYKKPNPIFVD